METLLAIIVGVLSGLGAAYISGYLGPKWLEEQRDARRRSAMEPRADLLRKLLADERFEARTFSTLRRVSGMEPEACRDLLVEIGARGVITQNGQEAWALIERKPLKDAAGETAADQAIG
ncbi:MAG: hypothetical protein RIC87_23190 [Kiloniellales bacterium]